MGKKIVPQWVSVVLLILCAATIIYDLCISLVNFMEIPVAAASFFFGSMNAVAAMLYCVTGYKKNSARLYKLVCILTVIASLFGIAASVMSRAYNGMWLVSLIFLALFAVIFIIFVFVKDLGKKRSFVLLWTSFILLGIYTIISAIVNPSTLLSCLCMAVTDVIFGFMVFAKYADKEARGSK